MTTAAMTLAEWEQAGREDGTANKPPRELPVDQAAFLAYLRAYNEATADRERVAWSWRLR